MVEQYRKDGILLHHPVGSNATDLCNTIISRGLVTQRDHAAYLGRELARAEFSLRSEDYSYVQDRA